MLEISDMVQNLFLILFLIVFFVMLVYMVMFARADNKNKQYKACIKQTVEMLREYSLNPEDIPDCDKQYEAVCKATEQMVITIFSEMLKQIPEKEREEYREQLHRREIK